MIRDTSSIEGGKNILEDSKYTPVVSGLFFHFEEAPTIEIPSAQQRLSRLSGLHRASVPQRQSARCDLEAPPAHRPWSGAGECVAFRWRQGFQKRTTSALVLKSHSNGAAHTMGGASPLWSPGTWARGNGTPLQRLSGLALGTRSPLPAGS
jgi:hypothetical protein